MENWEMERFQKVLENHHQYARDWKARTGGKVIGYFCPYVAEEVAYAAGVLPVRLLSENEPDDTTDRYFYGNCNCTRDILNQILKGRFDYLDGAVHANGCEWQERTFESWKFHKPLPYMQYVYTSNYVEGIRVSDALRAELAAFKKSLEEWTGKAITNEALDNAIDVYNTNRRLMRQVYELRREDNPKVSGAEAMDMVLASQIMDKAEHNRMLTEVLKELPKRKGLGKERVRVMYRGSPSHNTKMERLIESLGATIVIDELCTGSAYFWNEVIPQEDRLIAIARRYLDKPPCPEKEIRYASRPAHILQLIERFNVQGVIIDKQIYCDPHGSDNHQIWAALKERHVPFHYIERDTTLPVGDTEARIEAFIDMLHPELV
jgi:benzoyl-CoA reductase subunit C